MISISGKASDQFLKRATFRRKFFRLVLVGFAGLLILVYAQMTSKLEKKTNQKPRIKAALMEKRK